MRRRLKMFVWEGEGVLRDFTNGMICVLAHDLEEALALIKQKYPNYTDSFPASNYEVVEKPEAFAVYGGG